MGLLVGLATVGVFVWFCLTAVTKRRSPAQLAFVGLAATFGLTSLLGPPMEDKGAAFALALILALALRGSKGLQDS
jgi:predicted permease